MVTPTKQAFYCFAGKIGGDVIGLAAHIKSCTMREAAEFLAGSTLHIEPAVSEPTIPATVPEKKKAGLNPLTYLQPEHPLVQALGISKETADHFGAGYAPKGIMRGRLAIPIHDADGVLLAYCGQAVNGESPTLIFPKDFQPQEFVFNIHRLQSETICLLSSPLQVMKTFECGIENVASFLTELVIATQFEMLADFMRKKKCDSVEFN